MPVVQLALVEQRRREASLPDRGHALHRGSVSRQKRTVAVGYAHGPSAARTTSFSRRRPYHVDLPSSRKAAMCASPSTTKMLHITQNRKDAYQTARSDAAPVPCCMAALT